MPRGFRDFLMRGNVIDPAVAVVVGAVVAAFSTDFIGAVSVPMTAATERFDGADAATPAPSDEAALLTEIRDLVAADQRRPG